MIPEFENLRVRRNPLRLTVQKSGREFSVDQLSDGEKGTLAMIGDLARRLALANQTADEPLNGLGIVLIDEIELHMHPSWQRKVLPVLRKTFPNIQFMITTNSPQILSEADEAMKLFLLSKDENQNMKLESFDRMDGYDSNYILETYMGTQKVNPAFQKLMDQTTDAIDAFRFEEAEKLISKVQAIVGQDHASMIELEMNLKRAKWLSAKASD